MKEMKILSLCEVAKVAAGLLIGPSAAQRGLIEAYAKLGICAVYFPEIDPREGRIVGEKPLVRRFGPLFPTEMSAAKGKKISA